MAQAGATTLIAELRSTKSTSWILPWSNGRADYGKFGLLQLCQRLDLALQALPDTPFGPVVELAQGGRNVRPGPAHICSSLGPIIDGNFGAGQLLNQIDGLAHRDGVSPGNIKHALLDS